VRFDRAFVAQAGCSQSRAAYSDRSLSAPERPDRLATWNFRMYREDTPNIPRSLKAAGYRTGIIGKLHVNPEEAFPFDMHEIRSANFARKNLGDYAKYAEAYFNADDRPFFLSVNYPDAHGPWLRQVDGLPKEPLGPDDVKAFAYLGIDPPPMREAIANHYNCMSRLDSLVGDLLDALERSGKADNTLVIYFGDHGADFLRGKRTSYEGGVRVPLIVRWPQQRQIGPGSRGTGLDRRPDAHALGGCPGGAGERSAGQVAPAAAARRADRLARATSSPNSTRTRPGRISIRSAPCATIATS
jgi:N-sulfoglucosamine sulfohydrolase